MSGVDKAKNAAQDAGKAKKGLGEPPATATPRPRAKSGQSKGRPAERRREAQGRLQALRTAASTQQRRTQDPTLRLSGAHVEQPPPQSHSNVARTDGTPDMATGHTSR